jgi:hypothetical protein
MPDDEGVSGFLRALRGLPPDEAETLLAAICDRSWALGAQEGGRERDAQQALAHRDHIARRFEEARQVIHPAVRRQFPPPPPPPVADWNPPPPKRKEHWLVTLGGLVFFVCAVWLGMAVAVTGAAFVVSWAGGDVVGWLFGAPTVLGLSAAVITLTAERILGRKGGGGDA